MKHQKKLDAACESETNTRKHIHSASLFFNAPSLRQITPTESHKVLFFSLLFLIPAATPQPLLQRPDTQNRRTLPVFVPNTTRLPTNPTQRSKTARSPPNTQPRPPSAIHHTTPPPTRPTQLHPAPGRFSTHPARLPLPPRRPKPPHNHPPSRPIPNPHTANPRRSPKPRPPNHPQDNAPTMFLLRHSSDPYQSAVVASYLNFFCNHARVDTRI